MSTSFNDGVRSDLQLLPNVKLTPVCDRLLDKLADGEQHPISELISVIDVLSTKENLLVQISLLRSAIFHSGFLIAGHSAGKRGITSYQLVRRLRISLD
jgi:hypothetical protein